MTSITKIRLWLTVFIIGLVGSGITAFPLQWELQLASQALHTWLNPVTQLLPGFTEWVDRVNVGLQHAYGPYPFIAYGTDWLAFAHLIIALAFLGPLRDPIRNIWTIQWGMLACVAIIPLALIAGSIRGIPLGWQLIDISFGILGIIPLWIAYRETKKMEAAR